jgi:hypothetical protein
MSVKRLKSGISVPLQLKYTTSSAMGARKPPPGLLVFGWIAAGPSRRVEPVALAGAQPWTLNPKSETSLLHLAGDPGTAKIKVAAGTMPGSPQSAFIVEKWGGML